MWFFRVRMLVQVDKEGKKSINVRKNNDYDYRGKIVF